MMRGAAIECRVYAEDPANSFFPSPGRILVLRAPAGPGIRDDSGVYEGWTVPIEYDPLISKLVAWGATRDEAVGRMRRALSEYRVEGIKTNIPFFLELLDDPDFQEADLDTGYLDRWMKSHRPRSTTETEKRDFAVLAAALFHARRADSSQPDGPALNAWKLDARRRSLRRS